MEEQVTVVMAQAATRKQSRVRGWFYVSAALFVIFLSVAGFGPSMIDQSRRNAPPTPLVIAHGIIASAWLLLFLMQATLVATRRVAVHRRLGMIGPVLAVVLIVLGFLTTIETARRGYDLSGDLTRTFVPPGSPPPTAAERAAAFLPPLFVFLNFGLLVAAGLWYRHRPDIHKRLTLFALIPLAGEPIIHLVGYLVGHWPASQGVLFSIGLTISILLLSVNAIYDKVSQGRIHPVSVWVPIMVIVEQVVLLPAVFSSAAWHEIAEWLIR
jgi:hypothetical protein